MTPVLRALIAALAFLGTARAADPAPNSLTESERAAGWRLLFDGETSQGWRAYGKPGFPDKGWAIEDGCIRHLARGGGGDIITTNKFDDYEFAWEWKVNAGGNGGLKYFVIEDRPDVIGHEYQLMGEADLTAARRDLKHATGSFYDVLPAPTDLPLRPPGTWNESRLVVHGHKVEHWLNGRNILTYELGSDPVKAAIAKSKFRGIPRFGTKFPHHLLLQDHGGDMWFRNLKLRPLSP